MFSIPHDVADFYCRKMFVFGGERTTALNN